LFEPVCAVPVGTQKRDSLICKDAIGTTAIGHNLLVLRELREASLQISYRNGKSTGKMSGRIFFNGSHIKQDDITL
jgi:hypothetical protein